MNPERGSGSRSSHHDPEGHRRWRQRSVPPGRCRPGVRRSALLRGPAERSGPGCLPRRTGHRPDRPGHRPPPERRPQFPGPLRSGWVRPAPGRRSAGAVDRRHQTARGAGVVRPFLRPGPRTAPGSDPDIVLAELASSPDGRPVATAASTPAGTGEGLGRGADVLDADPRRDGPMIAPQVAMR